MSDRIGSVVRRVTRAAVISLVMGIWWASTPRASDDIRTREFALATFNAVTVGFPAEFEIRGSNRNLLSITAEPKVLAALRFGVQSGRLSLDANSFRTVRPINVRLEGTHIDSVSVGSAGSIVIRDLKAARLSFESNSSADISIAGVLCEELQLDASGAESIRIGGRAGAVQVAAAGSSDIDARNLEARTVSATASDASTLHVRASRELHANASGSATIKYHGRSPVSQRVADAAEVVRGD